MQTKESKRILNKLELLVDRFGANASVAINQIVEFVDAHPNSEFSIAIVSCFICVIPSGAEDLKLDCILAVDATTSKVLIDANGIYGERVTAAQAYVAYLASLADELEEQVGTPQEREFWN